MRNQMHVSFCSYVQQHTVTITTVMIFPIGEFGEGHGTVSLVKVQPETLLLVLSV